MSAKAPTWAEIPKELRRAIMLLSGDWTTAEIRTAIDAFEVRRQPMKRMGRPPTRSAALRHLWLTVRLLAKREPTTFCDYATLKRWKAGKASHPEPVLRKAYHHLSKPLDDGEHIGVTVQGAFGEAPMVLTSEGAFSKAYREADRMAVALGWERDLERLTRRESPRRKPVKR